MGKTCGTCERYNEKIDILTEKITSYEQLYEAIKREYKFIVVEETVLDISSIMSSHPGGPEMLKKFIGKKSLKVLGREVGRLFYGGYATAHDHSELAIKMIDNMKVGSIKSELDKIIFRPVRKQAPNEIEKETWKLISKKMISAEHAVFQFRSPNFKVAAMLPDFVNCGKYFTVSISWLLVVVFNAIKTISQLCFCLLLK